VAGQRLLHTLRCKIYEHYQALSLTYYDNRQDRRPDVPIIQRCEQVENLMVHAWIYLITGLSACDHLHYMYEMKPEIGVIILIPIPLIGASNFCSAGLSAKNLSRHRDRIGNMNAKLQDNLSGIRSSRLLAGKQPNRRILMTPAKQVLLMNVKGIRLWSSFWPGDGFVSQLGVLTVLGMGAYLVLKANDFRQSYRYFAL